jgi:hypothetical protein
MVAPVVASLMLTDCALVYVPAVGLKVGVGTVIVYAAEATAELVSPLSSAIALIVSDVDTGMAAVYLVELLDGVVPLVV